MGALIQRRDDAQRKVNARSRISDPRAGNQRYSLAKTRRGGCATRALRNIFVGLAVFERAWSEAFHRGDDELAVDLVDLLPSESHSVKHAGGKILDEDVADFDEFLEHLLAVRILSV